jgi:hypothetical protein
MGAFTHGQKFAFSLSFYWVEEQNVAIGKSGVRVHFASPQRNNRLTSRDEKYFNKIVLVLLSPLSFPRIHSDTVLQSRRSERRP